MPSSAASRTRRCCPRASNGSTPPGHRYRGEQVTLHAAERSRVGDTYTYDLDVRDVDGGLVERWEGLRLQAVRKTDGSGPWVPALLGPYLERQVAQFLPGSVRCAVEPDPSVHSAGRCNPGARQTTVAVSRMLERPVTVLHRGDGKPELIGEGTADLRVARRGRDASRRRHGPR